MASPLIAIDPRSLREFKAWIEKARGATGATASKRLAVTHQVLAREIAGKAQSRARSMGGVHAKGARAITGRGNMTGARIGINTGRNPWANVAFWGAKQSTGWNVRNINSRPQHPRWVGAEWDVGEAGGPYAINATIRVEKAHIVSRFDDLLNELARDVGFT